MRYSKTNHKIIYYTIWDTIGSWGSSVNIEIRLWAGRLGFTSRRDDDRIFISSPQHPGSLWNPRRGKGGGGWCEANQSLPSSTEVRNVWSYTSTPSMHLHGVVLS
jgi:hypothetical protein